MRNKKYSVILSNVGNCGDRYCKEYSPGYTIGQLFDRVAQVEGVTGVELIGNVNIRKDNMAEIKNSLEKTGLQAVAIIPDHFSESKWKNGAFTSKDAGVRREAVAVTKEMIDVAVQIGCPLISLWPGQDGYDYYFQSDYIRERSWFEEGMAQCCSYNKDIKVSIEYKIKEPRTRSYPSNVYSALLLVNSVNMENCGVTIDYGHAAVAYENVAESVAVLKKYGDKLFHLHMNDNYCLWDDDMITGSIHTIPYIELFWWLKKTGYNGYISTDQYPYREDGLEAVRESVKWFAIFDRLAEIIDDYGAEDLISQGNAAKVSQALRKAMFPNLC